MLPSGCSFDSIDGSRHCRHISLGLCTEHTFPLTFALRVLYAILVHNQATFLGMTKCASGVQP
jgi:hypothetical protein